MERELTCIVCPMGCRITVKMRNGKVEGVSGNTCPRGERYAIDECTNPKRTLTTTMRCENGEVISVKTDRAIPKDKMFECMKIINSSVVSPPVLIGDVIIENVFGANIVATKNVM